MSDVSDALGITVKEGESMIDALTRTAKEKAHNTPEPEKVIDVKPGKKAPAKKSSGSKSLSAKAAGGDPNEGQPVNPDVYSALHVYKRPGESDGQARYSATHERSMHGPNTLIFAHLHQFGEKCDSSCKLKVVSD